MWERSLSTLQCQRWRQDKVELYTLSSCCLSFIFTHILSLNYSNIRCYNIVPRAITTICLSQRMSLSKSQNRKLMNNTIESAFGYNNKSLANKG